MRARGTKTCSQNGNHFRYQKQELITTQCATECDQNGNRFWHSEEEPITTTCAAECDADDPNTSSKNCDLLLSPSQNSLQTSAQPSFRARCANGAKTNSQHGGRPVCKLWGLVTAQCAIELPRARCKREADGSCQRRVGCSLRVTIAFPILRRRCVYK